MNLGDLDFNSAGELCERIRQVNEKYYEPYNANVLYLEELTDRTFTAYIIDMRDAYTHLVRVFDYDIQNPKGKDNAKSHLHEYLNHLQNGIYDSYRKLVDVLMVQLKEIVPEKDMNAIRTQLAQRAAELRIMAKGVTIDDKIERYKAYLAYLEDIKNKFSN
jgi:hypothetical protein